MSHPSTPYAQTVSSADETNVVTVKDSDVVVDSIGLMIGDKSDLGLAANEAEIGAIG